MVIHTLHGTCQVAKTFAGAVSGAGSGRGPSSDGAVVPKNKALASVADRSDVDQDVG